MEITESDDNNMIVCPTISLMEISQRECSVISEFIVVKNNATKTENEFLKKQVSLKKEYIEYKYN